MTATRTGQQRPIQVVLGAIALAWCLAIVVHVSGSAGVVHHDAVSASELPLWVALSLSLVAWQLMIVAMMLPSSLPMIRLFGAVSASQPRSKRAVAAFLVGYGTVWTVFGAAALVGDIHIHRWVEAWPWLESRPHLITSSVLVLAGAFQFSKLKQRCLRECRHPLGFLIQRYGWGARPAFRLGRAHGMYCLGCCWALMVVGFAAGVTNLWWMAALTLVMVLEKTTTKGARAVTPVGAALIAGGVLVLLLSGGVAGTPGGTHHG